MTIFVIESEADIITAFPSGDEASVLANAGSFRTEEDWTQLAAAWPASRLINIWNNLPGVTPVKKFTNRETAIRRIW